jgi:hypothetical protein
LDTVIREFYSHPEPRNRYVFLAQYLHDRVVDRGGVFACLPMLSGAAILGQALGFARMAATGKEYSSGAEMAEALATTTVIQGLATGPTVYKISGVPGTKISDLLRVGLKTAERVAGVNHNDPGDERLGPYYIGMPVLGVTPDPGRLEFNKIQAGWDGTKPEFVCLVDQTTMSASSWASRVLDVSHVHNAYGSTTSQVAGSKWVRSAEAEATGVQIWKDLDVTLTMATWGSDIGDGWRYKGILKPRLGVATPGVMAWLTNWLSLARSIALNDMIAPSLANYLVGFERLLDAACSEALSEDAWRGLQRWAFSDDMWKQSDVTKVYVEGPKGKVEASDTESKMAEAIQRWGCRTDREGRFTPGNLDQQVKTLKAKAITWGTISAAMQRSDVTTWTWLDAVTKAKNSGLLEQFWVRNDLVAMLLPKLRFLQSSQVDVGSQVFPKGIYELPKTKLLMMTGKSGSEVLFMSEDGSRHWHPNAGMYDNNKPCWGHGVAATEANTEMADSTWVLGLVPYLSFIQGYLLTENTENDYPALVGCGELVVEANPEADINELLDLMRATSQPTQAATTEG